MARFAMGAPAGRGRADIEITGRIMGWENLKCQRKPSFEIEAIRGGLQSSYGQRQQGDKIFAFFLLRLSDLLPPEHPYFAFVANHPVCRRDRQNLQMESGSAAEIAEGKTVVSLISNSELPVAAGR
jgi:hypothetical protein